MRTRFARRRMLGLGLAAFGSLALGLPRISLARAQQDPPTDVPLPPAGGDAPVPSAGDDAVPSGGAVFEPMPPAAAVQDPWGIRPVSLVIPKFGVEADVAPVNYDKDGLMDVPPDPDLVAWFEYGSGMGVAGNAIFAAHVDWGGLPRVFYHLRDLEPGDAILVSDVKGRGFQYVVATTHVYDADGAPVDEIFSQASDQPIVTLITCGGRYRAATREYLDRVVVVARGA